MRLRDLSGFTWCYLFFFCFSVSSCLKNNDNTSNGPGSGIKILNYVVNGASFMVLSDNSPLTDTALSFGSGTRGASGSYVRAAAGIHTIKMTLMSGDIALGNFSFQAGKNYSLFAYDSLKNESVKTLLLKDDTTSVDTIAKARFLQFIPSDSLTLLFKINNIAKDSASDKYLGSKTLTGSENEFALLLTPATYQVQLRRGSDSIAQLGSFTARAGKIYSFISKGTIKGTGIYKESIDVMQHN